MTGLPRPVRPPRVVAGCWAVSVASGVFLLAIGPTTPNREPAALSPYSLAAYLRRVAGPDARDVRVNGFYGSGHAGAWQFVAHITWSDASGDVSGGTTNLPILAGSAPLLSTFDVERLRREHRVGWTVAELDRVLDRVDGVNDPLGMLELEITAEGRGDVLACSAGADRRAVCEGRDRTGRRTGKFADSVSDSPLDGALAVQRVG